jgi:hypothetical protein
MLHPSAYWLCLFRVEVSVHNLPAHQCDVNSTFGLRSVLHSISIDSLVFPIIMILSTENEVTQDVLTAD